MISIDRVPTATIFKSDAVNDSYAPFVVSFSSRGPNPETLDILKVCISPVDCYLYIVNMKFIIKLIEFLKWSCGGKFEVICNIVLYCVYLMGFENQSHI